MLAVYVACVSRWCGQRDFVVPFLIAGRDSQHERTVGYFPNVLYLRMRLGGAVNFFDLLKLVSNEFYRAVFRQDSCRMAARRPELLRGTLCQWLSWHPADVTARETADITDQLGFTVQGLRFQTPEELTNVPPGVVDIEMSFFEMAGDISALAIYRADHFGERTMVRLMRECRLMAKQFVADPKASVATISE
jgi:hypothetical protein